MVTTRKPARKPGKSTGPKRDIYQEVTDRIVAALEAGTAPWRMPWNTRSGRPQNLEGRAYRGINVLLTGLAAMEAGYSSPFWLTFKQAKERGGTVKKGEKGTLVVFWTTFQVADKETGKPKTIPMLRHYSVFNLEQTDDVKLPKRVVDWQAAGANFEHEPVESAEAIVAAYLAGGPQLRHGGGRAFYRVDTDVVTVPSREAFAESGEYYSTLFHELGHSTGHPDRLARKFGAEFGCDDYGREELVAEMTSAFLQAETGIESAMDNSAAYLAGWVTSIKEDPKAVVVAAGAAQRAVDLVLGRPAPGAKDADTTEAPEAAEGQQERHAA
jgi:antirestriction protein ArdC